MAVCDILGFKDLVKSRDIEQLVEGDLSLFRRLVGFSVSQGAVPDLPPGLKEIREHERVGIAWFSDTLLVYAVDDEDLSCRNVLETVGWLLFLTMSTRTRLRVGITYGEFFAEPENEMYVGPAIVEAHELEQAQEWAGAALAESAARRIPPRRTTGERFQWWVCEYDLPLKPGSSVSCANLAVDWTQGAHKSFPMQWAPSHAEPTEAEKSQNQSIYLKWANTRRFHGEVCATCHPSNAERGPRKAM